jgi:hypothetical protein
MNDERYSQLDETNATRVICVAAKYRRAGSEEFAGYRRVILHVSLHFRTLSMHSHRAIVRPALKMNRELCISLGEVSFCQCTVENLHISGCGFWHHT